MSEIRTKSTAFATAHVREYELLEFKQHPEWVVRPEEEEKLYNELKELKVTDLCPKGPSQENTSTAPLPDRINCPSSLWQGYKTKPRNLRYETTSQASYGRFLPTAYEMPHSFHGLSRSFYGERVENWDG